MTRLRSQAVTLKSVLALALGIMLACAATLSGHAQAAESIWLTASRSSYAAGDTVIVAVNARSATPIQGFNFKIRYDPACLRPVDAASPIAAMNGLLLPQQGGLVDASFASTTPTAANGQLAEVRFLALASCNTQLVLESAALAIKNQSGFAAPLGGVSIGDKMVTLAIGPGSGQAALPPAVGTPLSLAVDATPAAAATNGPAWPSMLPAGLLVLVVAAAVGAGLFWLVRQTNRQPPRP